ncbi:MAG: hypothetical protein UW64_C0020G0023, partial [Microgenomates group bacterium GW2011_GWC1_44_37]
MATKAKTSVSKPKEEAKKVIPKLEE